MKFIANAKFQPNILQAIKYVCTLLEVFNTFHEIEDGQWQN